MKLAILAIIISYLTSSISGIFFRPSALQNERTMTTVMCRTGSLPVSQNSESTPRNQILRCFNGATVKVVNANYGQSFPDICQAVGIDESVSNVRQYCSESIQTYNVISQLCNGRLSCSIDLPSILHNLPQNCLDCTNGKYPPSLGLQVEYKCVSNILGFKPFSGPISRGMVRSVAKGGMGTQVTLPPRN